MPAKFSLTTALLLAALSVLLSACGPNGDMDAATDAATTGTVPAQFQGERTAQQINAAKARVPYQYRSKEPLNLLDYRVNLNPNINRSSP